MENTRLRRPKSPALPPSSLPSPSPGSLFRSKSRSSSAAITLPENNSCAANTSHRSTTTLRSKSATKARSTKSKDEENLNPFNSKTTKAGFAKFLKSSPATSPSAWALSPGRSLGSPLVLPPQTLEPAVADGGRRKLGGGAVSGVLRFFRPKKAAAAVTEADELHRYRILENRLMQWKIVNVRAEISMANAKTLARERIFSVWLHNLRMRNRILERRIEVEKLRKEIKLYKIIFPQVSLLKQWAKMDRRNQETVANLAYLLSTLSLRLPLLHGAKGDIKDLEQALSMAMEVMSNLEEMITKRTAQQLEKTLYMLTERLSIVNEQDECLENLEEVVCSLTTLLAKENSVRIQLMQATNFSTEDSTVEL